MLREDPEGFFFNNFFSPTDEDHVRFLTSFGNEKSSLLVGGVGFEFRLSDMIRAEASPFDSSLPINFFNASAASSGLSKCARFQPNEVEGSASVGRTLGDFNCTAVSLDAELN